MPGFISSLKSRLPTSPFSPPKNTAPALAAVEAAEPAEPAEVAAESEAQPTAEVLPSEAILAPNTSTVALTLTPANGQSSQQLPTTDEETAEPGPNPPEELTPAVEAASEAEAELPVVADPAPQPLEAQLTAAVEPQPAQVEVLAAPAAPVSSDVADAAPIAPELDNESLLKSITPDVLVSAEVLTPTADAKPASIRSKTSLHSLGSTSHLPAPNPAETTAEEAPQRHPESPIFVDEPTVEAALPVLQVEAATPEVSASEEMAPTPEVKEAKQPAKKKRFGISPLKSFTSSTSQEGASADESPSTKPKKNQALAGRFKQVIGQVRSKVKKEKEAEKALKDALIDNSSAGDGVISSDNLTPADEPAVLEPSAAQVEAAVPVDPTVTALQV
ncbi:uncharacterized protein VP01_690g3 [Puccinia sorghi]|uniref:Uncharacterized protein n=1 Tax=Puccinia sorghi TaxID=27349 RepID=A0A0L6UE73_9BASI|nr:uncharacterized protein VP01_690g3 [Puccinia sorghi]